MTVTQQGVSFSYGARRKAVLFFVLAAEAVLSFFVYVSLSAHLLWPEKSKAATGVANVLSYEGRLMDASGNPLGGTGEPYCFRFSIYDAQSEGTKLWPTGTPATTTATTTDGVFNALVGQADTLDYNFYASDTTYLNVDVYTATSTNGTNCFSGSWETLSPRQRIAATGYARSAENVYSSLLRTDVTNSRTQIGSGVGGGSPIMFGLDVKNTNDYVGQSCTTSGTLWYNSAISKALVCENGVIQTVSNSGATTTIAAINANAGTPATTGTVVFSNSNGVSFGINGNTITASINGAHSLRDFANMSRVFITNLTNITAISQRPVFAPFYLNGALTWNRALIEMSRSTSGSNNFTIQMGLYTFVNETQISRLASLQNTFSASNTASISGVRMFALNGIEDAGTTLNPGIYVMGLYFSAANTASMNYSLRGAQTVGPPVGLIASGSDNNSTATSQLSSINLQRFLGRYTATTAAMPGSVAFSHLQHWTSMAPPYFILQST